MVHNGNAKYKIEYTNSTFRFGVKRRMYWFYDYVYFKKSYLNSYFLYLSITFCIKKLNCFNLTTTSVLFFYILNLMCSSENCCLLFQIVSIILFFIVQLTILLTISGSPLGSPTCCWSPFYSCSDSVFLRMTTLFTSLLFDNILLRTVNCVYSHTTHLL